MHTDFFPGRSWLEINLEQLIKNLDIYRSALPEKSEIMAVVKADAYGHGDLVISRKLMEYGIRNFAVSNIDEAIRLRDCGITGDILILGYTPTSNVKHLIEYDITQTILSEEYAKELYGSNLGRIKVQFAIDTGMNRIGLDADDLEGAEAVIREYYDKFDVKGVFTHLATADSDSDEGRSFTNEQIDKFSKLIKRISDLQLGQIHCLNSAGGIFHKTPFHNIVRLGIIMYGLRPDYNNELPIGIKPILTWKSVVSMVKEIDSGETVGYGRSYMAEKKMKIATIPTGYADGYNRLLSSKGYVIINGKRANIVGRVCMDQMMVDVTHIPDVKLGDEVILLGQSGEELITADDMAQLIGTIGYEIVCGISKRVPRMYI